MPSAALSPINCVRCAMTAFCAASRLMKNPATVIASNSTGAREKSV